MAWQTKMWMKSAHWSFTQFVALLAVNILILALTFPFGISICFGLYVWDLVKGVKNPVHEGHGQKKKVCIIGGGVSGITSAVCMVEEGHDVHIFEKDHTWGGVWQFSAGKRTDNEEFSGQVWQNLITTSSAYITSFSSFPPPMEKDDTRLAQFPYHMTASMYFDYLTAYMHHGGVSKDHFNFNTTVDKMDKQGDKWRLHVTTEGKAQRTVECDWVIVSTGQHQVFDKSKQFKGLDDFKGDVVSSSEYVNPKPFVGKRVLVIGGGDSGADIVKHIGDVCAKGQCYMSLRRGAHVTPRYFNNDELPIDYAMLRFACYLPHLVRLQIQRIGFLSELRNVALTCKTTRQLMRLRDLCGMTGDTYFTTKSEEMCKAFAAGTAHLKPEVERFTATGVEFKTPVPNVAGVDCGPVEIDAVVLCTGFKTEFPMLPANVRDHAHLNRYRLVFHPDLENVAFIGFCRPAGFGAIPPCAEMQARWTAQVVSGKVDLPDKATMRKVAADTKKLYNDLRVSPNQMLIYFPYYLAEIAYEFGANPQGLKLFMKSPKLWLKVMFGPYTSHQYRLSGPHAKPKMAEDFIMRKISYPEKNVNIKSGILSRPPRALMLAASLIFGTISKIPITGKPFTPCL